MISKQVSQPVLLLFAAILCVFIACTKSDLLNFDGVNASPTVALPLGKVNFTFKDFIKSDTLLKVGSDSSVQILYSQDSIAAYSVADIVSKATGNITANANRNIAISDLPITPFMLNKSVKLSDIVNGFTNPVVKTTFTANYGRSTVLPPFTETANSTTSLDDLTEFTTVTLTSGVLAVTVQNQFPFGLQNLNIEILDRGNGNALLTTLTFATIAAGGTATTTGDLSNKTFSNQLAYRVPTISSPGTGAMPVLIDPNATINVEVKSQNFKIKSGRFKFVQTTLAADTVVSSITTGNPDQKLKEITIKSANAAYTINSPAGVSFQLDLLFPSITVNGVAVTKRIDVTNTTTTGSISFTNAIADLSTIAAQPYNQLPVIAKAVLLASPGYVTLNPNSVITINTTFGGFEIGGAKGQFGTFNIAIPPVSKRFGYDFSYLSNTSKALKFDNPTIKLRYTNSFGIPIKANLSVSATGVLGTPQALNPPQIGINYPLIGQIGQTLTNAFTIDKNNSTIVDFMSILPNLITYSGNVSVNSTNPNELNFFTANSSINMGIDVALPLKFSSENLILRDTFKADFTKSGTDLNKFESASLKINHNNGFPVKTSIDIIALKGTVQTPVIVNFSIPAATINANGKVTTTNIGVQELTLTAEQLQAVLGATQIIVVGRVQTPTNGTSQAAFYTHYAFEIGLGMQAKLKL